MRRLHAAGGGAARELLEALGAAPPSAADLVRAVVAQHPNPDPDRSPSPSPNNPDPLTGVRPNPSANPSPSFSPNPNHPKVRAVIAQHASAAFVSLDACLAGLGLVQRHWLTFLR